MSAPIFLTGMNHGVINANGPTSGAFWDGSGDTGGTASISTTIKTWSNGRSLNLNKTSSSSNSIFRYRSFTASSVVVVSLAVYATTLPSGLVWFASLEDSGGAGDLELGYNSSDQKLRVKFAGGTETVSSSTITTGTWYTIDIRANVSSSSTYTCDWQIDGVAQTQHTKAVAAARTIDRIVCGNGVTATTLTWEMAYTDICVSTTSGDYPLGEAITGYIVPASDGTHNAGTNIMEDSSGSDIGVVTAYNLLDDTPLAGGGSTDRVQQTGSGTGNYAEVVFGALPSGTIVAVEGCLAYQSSGTASNQGATIMSHDSFSSYSDIYGNPTTRADMSESSEFYAANIVAAPGGGWTSQTIKARIGYSGDVSPIPYWLALMCEVRYVPSATHIGARPYGIIGQAQHNQVIVQ
jgi:hypothetical protein